jgi:hypothetical protein
MFHKRKEENIQRVFEQFRVMETDFKFQDILHKRKEEKMRRASEQFHVIENDVKIHERLIEKLTLEIKKSLQEISEIASGPKDLQGEVDAEGDEDILKINFGGSNVDIKRSILTKPKCGWNLFSCLFQKRWDGFHVRDKKGRIYVDLTEEWLRPLLEYMKYSDSSNHCLNASNRSLDHMIRSFDMDFIYSPYVSDTKTTLSGLLETSRIAASCTTERQKADFQLTVSGVCCQQLEDAPHFDFQLLYTLCPDDKTIPPVPVNFDYRFKSFLIVVQTHSSWFMYVHNTNQIKSRNAERGSSNRFSFVDFFPLRSNEDEDEDDYHEEKIEIHLKSGNQQNYKCFEIYEVRFSYEKIGITKPQASVEEENDFDEMSSLSASEFDETNRFRRLDNPEKLLKCVTEYKKSLALESDSLRYQSNRLSKEISYLAIYFHSTCSTVPIKSAWTRKDSLNLLESAVNMKRMPEHYRQRRRSEAGEEKFDIILSSSFNLAYFNVEGEIFNILRSTILRVIPNSQLALRVCGRWKEQAENGDIDEEGNLIVNCHKESFRQIISALQMTCFGENFNVLVNPLCRNFIEETLNYLLITPKLLIFADPHF